MSKKKNASSLISELKRKTRRNYSSEEKTRIIIEGMRGQMTIAELCRKEGLSQGKKVTYRKTKLEKATLKDFYYTKRSDCKGCPIKTQCIGKSHEKRSHITAYR